MNFDIVILIPSLNPSQITPSLTPLLSLCPLEIKQLRESSLCCSYMHWQGTVHWSMGDPQRPYSQRKLPLPPPEAINCL